MIENKKHPLKVNFYSLRKELSILFGEPTKPKRENGKQGRYYYLKTDLFDSKNAWINQFSQIEEQVEEMPF